MLMEQRAGLVVPIQWSDDVGEEQRMVFDNLVKLAESSGGGSGEVTVSRFKDKSQLNIAMALCGKD